ncbi:MAG: hypothetical protein ABJA78_09275 [Ferruginibacter sp.]
MEQKFYTDEFEKMLKDKSDDFKMIPSRRVWHSIYNDLHPSRRWPSVAMSLLLIGILLFTGYLNTGNSRNSGALSNSPENKVLSGSDKNVNEQESQEKIASADNPVTDVNREADAIHSANTAQNIFSHHTNTDHPASSVNRNNSFNSSAYTNPGVRGNHNIRRVLNNAAPGNNVITNPENGQQISSGIADNNERNSEKPVTVINNEQSDRSFGTITPEISSVIILGQIKTTDPSVAGKENNAEGPTDKNLSTAVLNKKNSANTELKAWMEDYALHNKPARNRWKGLTSWELYATPSLTYRRLSNNSKYDVAVPALNNQGPLNASADSKLAHKMSLGLELGGNIVYSFAKNFRFKTGVQLNYTDYNIDAWETNHPVLTTITLNDENSGYPYLVSKSTSLSTITGLSEVTLHSKTYQVSAIAGLDVKLYGSEKINWYAGATVQPSYIAGGKVYLLSSDHRNYVADNSMLRKFNLATAFETFISYKSGSYTWQVGPQFRYQLMSTYDKKYNQQENLFNTGLKFGIVKLF